MRWAVQVFDAIQDLLGSAVGSMRRRQAYYLERHGRWVVEIDTQSGRFVSGTDVRAVRPRDDRVSRSELDNTCLADAFLGLLQRLSVRPGVRWKDIERISRLVRRLARKEMT